MSVPVEIYVTNYCPYCTQAKALLDRRGIEYTLHDVTGDQAKRQWLTQATGRRTVPQIFIEGQHVGGFDDLVAADRSGRLQELLGGGA